MRTYDLDHEDTTYRAATARISDTFIGREDHGILTASLTLDYGDGSFQGTPIYVLEKNLSVFVSEILRVAGGGKWENLKGRYVQALFTDNDPHIIGLAHPIEQKVVIFKEVLA